MWKRLGQADIFLILIVIVLVQALVSSPVLAQSQEIRALDWSVTGKYLAVTTVSDVLLFDEFQSASRSISLYHDTKSISALAFSQDERWLAVGDAEKAVHVWDIETQSEIATLTPDAAIRAVVFSPDGAYLAVIQGSQFPEGIRIWQTETWQEVSSLVGGAIWNIHFAPEGIWILTDQGVGRITGDSYQEQIHFDPPIFMPFSTFSPLGDWFVIVENGTLRLWNLHSKTQVLTETPVVSLHEFSGDDRFLSMMTEEDLTNQRRVYTLINLETMARQKISVDFTSFGKFIPQTSIFLYRSANELHLLDMNTVDDSILPNAINETGLLVSSPDGAFLVSTLNETPTKVLIWEVARRQQNASYQVETVNTIKWLDQEWLMISLPDHRILQHVPSGQEYTLSPNQDLLIAVNKRSLLVYVEDNHVLVRSLLNQDKPQILSIP